MLEQIFFRSVFSLNLLNDFIKLCIKISIKQRTRLFVYDCVQEQCMSFHDNRFLDLIAFPTNIKGHKTANPVSPAENSRRSSLTFHSTLTCCFAHQLFARTFTADVFACPTVCFSLGEVFRLQRLTRWIDRSPLKFFTTSSFHVKRIPHWGFSPGDGVHEEGGT